MSGKYKSTCIHTCFWLHPIFGSDAWVRSVCRHRHASPSQQLILHNIVISKIIWSTPVVPVDFVMLPASALAVNCMLCPAIRISSCLKLYRIVAPSFSLMQQKESKRTEIAIIAEKFQKGNRNCFYSATKVREQATIKSFTTREHKWFCYSLICFITQWIHTYLNSLGPVCAQILKSSDNRSPYCTFIYKTPFKYSNVRFLTKYSNWTVTTQSG